ncbi:MAG: aminoglycoside phosphotransferase family protein [Candidatus Bathyarchaeota archaeon]
MGANLDFETVFSKKLAKKLFQKTISKFVSNNNSIVTISDIHILESIGRRAPKNESYLVEFVLHKKGVLSKCNKIVAKQPSPNQKFYSHLKFNEKYFSKILSIKIPEIKYIDFNSGFIFRDFISGKSIDVILDQILLQKYIQDWNLILFERIGQGLAELNYNLNIIHGDSRTSNWIFDEKENIIYLIDWDVAGTGDPAYDLSKLVYSIGRKFSKLIDISDFETRLKLINIFDQLCSAIISGYSRVDLDKLTIRKFSKYWIHYIFSVSPQIHKIIFYHGNHSTRKFRIIDKILTAFPLKSKFKKPFKLTNKKINQLIHKI